MDTNTLKNENQTLMKNGREFFDYQWGRFNNLMMKPTDLQSITEHNRKQTVKRGDLADMLMELCEESSERHGFDAKSKIDPLTFEELAAHMYLFFEAGFETSSSAQTFALYEMAVNPDVHDGRVTYDAVNDMQYLDRLFDGELTTWDFPKFTTKDVEKVPDTANPS